MENADYSLQCNRCYFCTFANVHVEANRTANGGLYGHHGIDIADGGDNLVTDFVISAPQVGVDCCEAAIK